MAAIDPGMLDAIRVVVSDAIRPLDERLGRVEAEQQAQRLVLHGIETTLDERFTDLEGRFTDLEGRFTDLEGRFTLLEAEVGTIEARTARLSTDLLDLTDKVAELTERVTEGFQTFKREVAQAFRDVGATQSAQQRYGRQISELRERVELLERRINRLEDQSGGVI
jgi:chromosome segregation ATPase